MKIPRLKLNKQNHKRVLTIQHLGTFRWNQNVFFWQIKWGKYIDISI